MNLELNNQQIDWLAQTDEINDIEASQVNGGMSGVGGSAAGQSAQQENLAAQQASAQQAKEFQDQSAAINADAQSAMKADQAFQSLANQIKTQ